MQNRGLKTLIISTALIPSLLIALALGIYLNACRLQDLNTLLRERGRAAVTQLAVAARAPLKGRDPASLQELAALALEERGVRAVNIYDEGRRLVAHAGPLMPAFPQVQLGATHVEITLEEEMRFLQPVLPAADFSATAGDAGGADAPFGWVAVEYSRQPYLLQSYHSLVIGGLIITLALVGTIATAVFASRRLDHIMRVLRQGIRRIEEGVFDAPVQTHDSGALQTLAEDLNRMAGRIHNANIELQRNLEQSNRDLRESLETVEVQNIELDLARREALEASRIKSEFLANTSHELRTPLNGIIGFTKLLLKSTLDPRQREYLETIRYSAENLLTIINDILDFSKIEAGKLVLDTVPFNLREVIEDTLAMLAPSAFEKGLDLLLLYDPEVVPELVGDPLRLRQILTNLISNGIKFTPHGHIVVRVSLTAANGLRAPLKISVTDTGIGLSPAQQSQLFKAFGQADASTSREFGGTGLGLAISKRLVEQMGGEIGLESQPGQGSTFWFALRLPIQQNPLPARQFDRLRGRRLLLRDSRPLSQLALRQLLESWDIEVIAGEQAEAPESLLRDALYDGGLFSLSQEEVARGELARLPATPMPLWVLLPGPTAEQPALPGVQLLLKPVGHVQLYDALCDRLCQRPHHTAPYRGATSNAPLHVLAVDDNPANLKLITILLEEQGAEVSLASGGRQALELCERHRFDLILLDIQMPELDGAQVAQMIRGGNGANRDTRIVALTAHLLPEEERRLLATGFNLCLTKPVTEQQIAQLLTPDAPEVVRAPPEPAGPARPVDLGLCLQRARHKPELAREFLQGLLDNLPVSRLALGDALATGQRADLLEHTHRLHGACCYSGVPRLQQHSRALEELLKRNAPTETIEAAAAAVFAAMDELALWQEQHDMDILFEAALQ